MRYVPRMPDLDLVHFDGKVVKAQRGEGETAELVDAKMTFRSFIEGRLRDPKFGASWEMVSAAANINQALTEAEKAEESFFVIDEADWNKLVDVVKNPSQNMGYIVEIAVAARAYFEAIIHATSTKPQPS